MAHQGDNSLVAAVWLAIGDTIGAVGMAVCRLVWCWAHVGDYELAAPVSATRFCSRGRGSMAV